MGGIEGMHLAICREADALLWPPDVFGFAAHFAKVTGVYTYYASRPELVGGIGKQAGLLGRRWRDGLRKKKLLYQRK